MKAIISYQINSQKEKNYYKNLLTKSLLTQICQNITGQGHYVVKELDDHYNVGRLLIIEYNGIKNYVSLSEKQAKGRNSSLQSAPSAYNLFIGDNANNKKLYFYFLSNDASLYTEYHKLYYKIMATAGFVFLNHQTQYDFSPFASVGDLISARDENRGKNTGNASTYVTMTNNIVQVFAKTYGANKYESTLIAVACALLHKGVVHLYNVCEKDLKTLPKSSIDTLSKFNNLRILYASDQIPDKVGKQKVTVYRSPMYIYHLIEKFGPKKCVCCDCRIPELIQGAHIWNVSSIKKDPKLDEKTKSEYIVSEDNGIWLCSNHHKLFDSNYITLTRKGTFKLSNTLGNETNDYIRSITKNYNLPLNLLTKKMLFFISKRTASNRKNVAQ